ncbi:MAG: SDR family NAD(P)-dependent oxidoreductase, partial [Actinomycetota bacterium]
MPDTPPPSIHATSTAPAAVVTGANSGIGRATAIAFAQAGYRVFGTVRGLAKADKLLVKARDTGVADRLQLIEMDVADSASVEAGFRGIFAAT